MSMNGFFKAFASGSYDAMLKDNSRIDEWIWEKDESVDSIDVATAWDVLQHILGGAGFDFDEQVDNALSNGACCISPATVIRHAQVLSGWTHEKLLSALENIDDDELYHLEYFNDEDGRQDLLDEFDKLTAFYSRAAEQRLGVIFYLA